MQRLRVLMIAAGLLLAALASACGTRNIGTDAPVLTGPADTRLSGVATGGFEVIRQNTKGYDDPALNTTLGLDLQDQAGQKALVISVKDKSFTTTVALEITYDPAKYHPVKADF